MAKIYTLTKAAVRALQEDHHRLRTQLQTLGENPLRGNNRTPQRDDLLIGKATAGVAARSGASMSSAIFTVQSISSAGVMADTDKGLTVYNVGDTAISSGDYLPIERDYRSGTWVARAPGAGGGGGGGVADVSYVKAQEYWQHSGTLPSFSAGVAWVSVKLCDSDGTGETGSAFDCYLPCSYHTDPNVVVDQVFLAAQVENETDDTSFWNAVSDTSDLAVGSVRMMTGNAPAPANGWALMDGNQDVTKTASGTAINMTGRVPLSAAVGTAAGTVGASTTTGETTPDTITSGSGGAISETTDELAAATVTTTGTALDVDIEATAVATEDAATGIEGTAPEMGGGVTVETETIEYEAGDEMLDVVTSVELDDDHSHEHTVTDPEHQHDISGTFSGTADAHTHDVTVPAHDHAVTADAHTHQIPGSEHTHDIEQMGSMGLAFYERIDNSNYA